MSQSLQDLREQMPVDRITQNVDTPMDWYRDWVFEVETRIDLGIEQVLESIQLSEPALALRDRAWTSFQHSYQEAERLRNLTESPEIRARILSLLRNLERVMYVVHVSGGGGSWLLDIQRSAGNMELIRLDVYHRLGGTVAGLLYLKSHLQNEHYLKLNQLAGMFVGQPGSRDYFRRCSHS